MGKLFAKKNWIKRLHRNEKQKQTREDNKRKKWEEKQIYF